MTATYACSVLKQCYVLFGYSSKDLLVSLALCSSANASFTLKSSVGGCHGSAVYSNAPGECIVGTRHSLHSTPNIGSQCNPAQLIEQNNIGLGVVVFFRMLRLAR